MLSLRRYFDALGNLLTPEPQLFDGLPRITASKYETSTEKRDRALKHLLKANHLNFAILCENRPLPNDLPHILGSAYLMGATAEQLQALYDTETGKLDPWINSPMEIASHDWRDYLGEKSYQRAYLDFFEDELVKMGYQWRDVVAKYMFSGPEPLIHGAIGGFGHPLVHLGYAYELDNREIAMEALALAATNYDPAHSFLDRDFANAGVPIQAPSSETELSLQEILEQIHHDVRFHAIFEGSRPKNLSSLFKYAEDALLEYYHKLSLTDIAICHQQVTKAVVVLLCTTHEVGKPEYNFYFFQLLAAAYGVRTLLPELPISFASSLVKSHWLLIISVYCMMLRPITAPGLIDEYDISGISWDKITKKAFHQGSGTAGIEDVHYLEVVRILREYALLWPSDDMFFLKAAAKFTSEFTTWSGLGSTGEK